MNHSACASHDRLLLSRFTKFEKVVKCADITAKYEVIKSQTEALNHVVMKENQNAEHD